MRLLKPIRNGRAENRCRADQKALPPVRRLAWPLLSHAQCPPGSAASVVKRFRRSESGFRRRDAYLLTAAERLRAPGLWPREVAHFVRFANVHGPASSVLGRREE